MERKWPHWEFVLQTGELGLSSFEVATLALGLDDSHAKSRRKVYRQVNGKCKGPVVGLNPGEFWEAEVLQC